MPRADAIARLDKDYGEHAIGMGLSPDGRALYELFVGDGGTWTMLVTRTDKISCIAAAGNGWQGNPLATGEGT